MSDPWAIRLCLCRHLQQLLPLLSAKSECSLLTPTELRQPPKPLQKPLCALLSRPICSYASGSSQQAEQTQRDAKSYLKLMYDVTVCVVFRVRRWKAPRLLTTPTLPPQRWKRLNFGAHHWLCASCRFRLPCLSHEPPINQSPRALSFDIHSTDTKSHDQKRGVGQIFLAIAGHFFHS
jgi:hypothetical protein